MTAKATGQLAERGGSGLGSLGSKNAGLPPARAIKGCDEAPQGSENKRMGPRRSHWAGVRHSHRARDRSCEETTKICEENYRSTSENKMERSPSRRARLTAPTRLIGRTGPH